MEREILLLGDTRLYDRALPAQESELPALGPVIQDLHDTLMAFRARTGAGRAIAAPQIGVNKRLIYMHIDRPVVIINPRLSFPSSERMRVWDDCMSLPGLWVQVERFKHAVLNYRDEYWLEQSLSLEGDLSELLQHEYDHLDGILMTMRAIDEYSFSMINPGSVP